ncbi:MAG: PKD domain-containing protein [Bacteroidota bacterium]
MAQVNANFTANQTSGCAPLSVSFTDLSTGPIQQWLWDFGNGNTSRFDDVIATYTNPGTYTVSLTVVDTVNGLSSTKTEVAYITVFSEPSADFTADQTSGCAPLTVNFSDASTQGDGAIVSYSWDFGDGSLGTGANPSHTYLSAGDYTVTLIVTDVNGCSDTRIQNDLISITDVANVSFNGSPRTACAAPITVSFNSTVAPAGSYTYLWDFGDGSTSSAPNPNHTYTVDGDYTVSLTITDVNGCSETVSVDDYILINNPNADFTSLSNSVCTGRPVSFINNSSGADSYTWNFGDGNTSTQTNPTHTYSTPGTYSVSLTANNSAGCSDTHIETNYITVNVSPAASFTATNNIGCQTPLLVNFSDQSIGNIIAWSWDFGNGAISSAPNPTSTYTNAGNYTVSLTVTSADGCETTETIPNFVILTEPDAEFTVSDPDGCLPHTVNFLDLSTSPTDPITNWVWNFGDGNLSNQQNPSHTYTTAGQYTVTLTVTTASGCQNTETFTFVEVGARPTANFDANPRIACVDTEIDFTDLTAGNVTDWTWYFGDGGTSNDPNPAHTYQDTGTFDITLIVENLGCFDTIVMQDFVTIQGAVADFSMTPTDGCNPPTDVQFFDQSINGSSFYWDFGDGNTSILPNPTHTFATVGTYTIRQVVTDLATGCVDDFDQDITITNPIASASGNPRFGCPPLDVNFTNSSLNATDYIWDFGDGTVSNAANPTHTYTAPGDYTVTLIASDGACNDTLILTDYVSLSGPTIDFDANLFNGCAPLPITFNDLSTPYGTSSFVSWQWNFGDGNTATGPNPTHTFTNPGQYDITLTVLDSDGCVQSLTKSQYITATFPTANFSTNDTIACPGAFVNFINTSVGSGLTYLWDFGDGTTSSAVNPTHLFPSNGTYTITLTATDVNGCSDIEGKFNFVSIGQPTAAFVADTTSATCPPLTVNFTDQSSPDVVDWFWDFGDGSTSALANPAKIYAVAGTYDISLTVTNAQGCRDTVVMDDLIDISGPTGSFSFSPQIGCQPLDVNFSVDSPNPLWTYDWDFGDGTGGTGTTITHTYFNDTTANPLMLIEDENGCVVVITNSDNIQIQPQPVPSFTADRNAICLGQSVSFSNTTFSERPITGYLWDFGDGNTSTGINPTYTYTDTGTYVVSLIATTIDGCIDTSATPLNIRVTGPPTAVFTANPMQDCVPFPVSFSESSTGFFPIVDWHWDFGDGDTANGQTITPHIYTTAGIYNPTLTVTDNKGCTGSISRTITVDPLPPVEFSAFRYGCAPLPISFTDETLGASPAVAWSWNFGDGNTSTQQNPTHTYVSDGFYTVSLTVTDANGCINTLVKTDYIQLNTPTANFTSNATPGCPPLVVDFTNLSTADTTLSYLWDFGDGNTSTQLDPSHTYYVSDTFTVTLIITNVFGCKDTVIMPDHVYTHDRPTASFSLSDTSVCVPENIIMSSTSSPSGSPITNYQWDFGLGSGATTPTATYLYTIAGTYNPSLSIEDANGCGDTATRTIFINPNPVADFQAGDTVGCAITTIGFQDLSTGINAPVAWEWTFGDGNTGSSQNPSNTYFNDGTYTVSLKVTDINGCVDSLTKNNYINLDHPVATFSIGSPSLCTNETVNFTDLSGGPFPIVSWAWDFGDGTPLVFGQNTSHQYISPGTYSVSLIITDVLGCQDTLTQANSITVNPDPVASFVVSPNQDCTPLTASFTDASSGSGGASIIAWNWDFGDGGNAFVQNPTYIYNTAGIYTASLTVTDDNNCTATHTENLQSLETPVVDFVADRRVGCAPATINFSDLTTSPYVKVAWLWDFGDGTTSALPNPSHTYTADGTYNVSLTVTDQNGCSSSLSRNAYIRLSHPQADFTWNQSVVCPNEAIGVQFTDASTPDTTITNWLWDFGDGTTSSLQNPSKSYSTPGTYSVSLTITNLLGCGDSESKAAVITVRNAPAPIFSASDSTDCRPFNITFTDLSTAGDAAITTWNWDFGDGNSSLSQNPFHTYTNAGTYTVQLTTTDANGCSADTSLAVTALPLPVAEFVSADTIGCAPQTVSFVNQSSSAFNITYYKWFFGDGDSIEFSANPTHVYTADGNYDVTLIIQDENGCRDTLTKTNYIRLSHPVADFTLSTNLVCPGNPVGVNFMDTSVPDTTLIAWFWDFGDGNTANVQNPNHQYTVPGTYTVSLIVSNILGCSDTFTTASTINVLDPPVANFIPSTNADCTPLTVSFTDGSTAGASAIVDWSWNFGDGNSSNDQNPTHAFGTAGIYTVSLTVTDGNGCDNTYSESVEAYLQPIAEFSSADTVGCAPQLVRFTDLSVGNGGGAITAWDWDFGDGNTSNLRNPSHTYATDGIYDVSLTVTNANGCQDVISKTAYIRLSHPIADFSSSTTIICPGAQVDFTDTSAPDTTLTNWLWDFGDGTTSTQQNPSHIYTASGTYTVSLIVTNLLNCSDTETKLNYITVQIAPTAQFTPNPAADCAPATINFVNTTVAGSSPVSSWAWDFGDSNTSSLENPSHTFANPNTYPVQLIATNALGCTDTAVVNVTAYESPQAAFVASDSIGCAPTAITFINQSTGPATIVAWLWDFGDGGTSTSPIPVHNYTADGVYDVSLTVTDVNGCQSTLIKPQYIRLSHPIADFLTNRTAVCPGQSIRFADQSIPDTTLMSWLWDFGDGSTSNLAAPIYTYANPGLYDITLVVTNILGCSDTIVRPNYITVYTPPTPAILASNTIGCIPLTVNFTDASTPGSSPVVGYSWNFGDGNTSTFKDPTHTFVGASLYTVRLTAIDNNGCRATAFQYIDVSNRPTADFIASDTVGCEGTIDFFDLSTGPNPITGWKWYFGDGDSANVQNPSHYYPNAGTYTVTLIVWDQIGCPDTLIRPDYITLTRPVADFSMSDNSVCPGTDIQFTDTSVPDFPIFNYEWDFGDGITTTQTNPLHSYANPGTYTVQLIITNSRGCMDTTSQVVTVFSPPTALFSSNTPDGCQPLTVNFSDLSTGNAGLLTNWAWDFGDGNTSNIQNPSHTFNATGVMSVSLTVTDDKGCTDTYTQNITVYPNPTVDFSADKTRGCAPDAITFTLNQLSGNALSSFFWDFGDGNTSTAANPTHTYATDGTYTVNLIVTDVNGCTASFSRVDYIRLSHPEARIFYTPAVGCPGTVVDLEDRSIADTTLISWQWDLDNGQTRSGQNVNFTYQTPGLYDVSLTVTNVLGCSNQVLIPDAVRIYNPPTASFAPADTSGCAPLSLQFFNQSTGGDTLIQSLVWDFGNGNSSNLPNPSTTFINPGIYDVDLTIVDLNGCRDTASQNVQVYAIPAADFVVDDSLGCAPKTVRFIDQTQAQSPIVSWFWDFGDGNTSTSAFPTHTYTNDGFYTVSLTTTDVNGCTNTLVKNNYIRLSHPIANFRMDQSIACPGTQINFYDESIADTTLLSWTWDFGDGASSNQQNPGHVYTMAGVYTVSLTVGNIFGCQDQITLTDTITIRQTPTADFVPSAISGCAPLSVNFNNTTVANGSPVVSYTWDFDNGNISNFVNPNQVLSTPGLYRISLLATDTYGCSDSTTQTIEVFRNPVAAFVADDSLGCSPKTINFLDQSQPQNAPLTNWNWTFGDGNISLQQFPNNTYLNDGQYSVTLAIQDANGCADTLTKPQYINLSHPVANFTKSANMVCPGTVISFADLSIPDTTLTNWLWDFGDGNSSSLQNPDHFYTLAGNYSVSLTVTNILGCSHTFTQNNFVDILQPPTTQFAPSSLEGCVPFDLSLQDQSNGNSAPIVSWLWDFGDGNTSTAANPNHIYTIPGTYTIVLTTTDNNGCSSSHQQDVVALDLPIANFFSVDTLGCAPHNAQFTDLSTGPRALSAWTWDFGDSNTSTNQNPQHSYNNDGDYDVSLVVTDVKGCQDTLLRTEYIRLNNPVADFTLDQPLGCPGLLVEFTDTSIPDTTLVGWLWDFGDGNTSFVQNPQHVYANPGQYDVSLTITNVLGCQQTHLVLNAVSVSVPPIAAFSLADSLGCAPFAIDLQDNSVAVSAPIVGWAWDFGNGDTALSQEPDYVFNQPGTYNIQLTIQDGLGCVDSTTLSVVATDAPTADFVSADTIGCAPHLTSFQDLSSGDYNIVSWNWDFGDGNTSTQRNPVHTYQQDGVYDVQLIVFDENGCSDTLVRSQYIRLSHPIAGYTTNTREGCEGLEVIFTDVSFADTTLVSWFWDFGDGTTSIQQNPSHFYYQNGVYDVSLVVTNILGCSDTIFRPADIRITPPPVAHFTSTDTSNCGPFQVAFTDSSTSSLGITQWSWFINDTLQASSQNNSYFFDQIGQYEVKLVVTDTRGCMDTAYQQIFVRPLPEVDFVASDTLGCAPSTITFTDQSFVPPVSWLWDFGDGNTSTDQNPAHTYQQDGVFSVSLTVVDQFGCTNSLTKVNYIRLDHPTTSFAVDYIASCPPVNATFTASSSGMVGIAKWDWDFGDGNTNTSLSPTTQHTYTAAGTYSASLTITDSIGCTATYDLPNAVTVLDNILPEPVSIYNVSVVDDQSVAVSFSGFKGIDFSNYTIYREEAGVGYVPIHQSFYVHDTVFIDQGINTLENVYCYKVGITNQCGTENDIDLVQNHCTINATAETTPGAIELNWTPYLGFGPIQQYEIYKVEDYNPVQAEFVTIVPGTVTRYTESIEDCFTDVTYRVKAIGVEDWQQSWSDTTQAQGENGSFGSANEILRATVENNDQVLVEWGGFNSDNVRIIYVEKSEDGGAFSTIATVPPSRLKLNDTDVDVQSHSYAYRIQAQDSCGNVTPISNVGKSILLTVEMDNKTPYLRWTPYEDWRFGVDDYRIEVYNDSIAAWSTVDIVEGVETEYRDEISRLIQPEYCYRVVAIEQGGNYTESYSNAVCVGVQTSVYGADAFTPNGDGINDIFYLKGSNVLTYNLKIFSRWGVLLYETNSIEDGWDGTYKGVEMPEGVYMYVAKGRNFDGRSYVLRGSISLYR